MSVAGTWKVTIKAPTGPEETVLELEEVGGGRLSGSQTGRGSTTEISDGKYDGRNITWINRVTKPMKIKVKFTGVVDGDKMEGKAKAGIMPAISFTAVRQS